MNISHPFSSKPFMPSLDNEDQVKTEPFGKDDRSEAERAIIIPADSFDATIASSIQKEPYIRTGQHSDIGIYRKQNEDVAMSFVSLSGGETPIVPFSISLVADGMGGHADGAKASRSVANYISQNLISRILVPLMNDSSVTEPVQSIMQRSVQDANRVIQSNNAEELGGTTLTCGVIIKTRLFLAHVGDSRAYLYNATDEAMKQITRDHSYVQQLIDSGEITHEEAAVHPRRNLLFKALTGAEVEIDMFTCSLPQTGTLMICSDGLWGSISDSEMQAIIAGKKDSLQQKCERLVALAIEGGTTDNISVVLTEFRL
ncbi:MAG: serine/threonine protein phosphatase PrpC [Cellvibrionaceae bacterium]|jgi:serine/threonine protein phosphatase PrpC